MFSFNDLTRFFQERWSIFDRESKYASKRSALHLQKFIKGLHGKQLPGYPAKGSNKTPLLNTGKLRGGVYSESIGLGWRVSTTQQKIATIQEYGAYYKMTPKQRAFLFAVILKDAKKKFIANASKKGTGYIRIPARPLWRYAESQQETEVIGIFEKAMEVLFKD